MFTIKANRTSLHIAGITERMKGSEFTYSVSACGALSRSVRFESLNTSDDLAEILAAARLKASISSRKLCKNCESAAETQLSAK